MQVFNSNLILLLLLMILSLQSTARQSTKIEPYIYFVGPVIFYQHDEMENQMTQEVRTIGGFVELHPNPARLTDDHYARAYFYSSKPNEKEVNNTLVRGVNKLYIGVGLSYRIDVLLEKNDSVVYRYILKRNREIPELSYTIGNGKVVALKNTETDNYQISLAADEEIIFGFKPIAGEKNLAVIYTLLGPENRSISRKITNADLGKLKLEAGKSYELRYSYDLQQETNGVIYISVKPYWYKTLMFYMIVVGFILSVGFILFTLIYKRRLKQSEASKRKLEQEAVRLQSLLNPHFTFNALSSIQGLMNTNRIDEANQYLEDFSKLLRHSLTKSQQLYCGLNQELEMMEKYIRLEALRFGFKWKVNVSPEMDTSGIEIPTLILQPLIENAIKHGLSGLAERGELIVSFRVNKKTDSFVMQVEDNGTWKEATSDAGLGLLLTNERINTLNQIDRERRIELFIDKSQGTCITLKFYKWIDN